MSLKNNWHQIWRQPDRRPIYEWAREHLFLPNAASLSIKGQRFNVDISRFMVRVFEALQDDHVRTVTLMKPTQSGGTLIADVWLPWTICNDPGPFQWNMQPGKTSDDHAETRIVPILEACEPARKLFPEDRHQKRKDEIIFRGGTALWIQPCSIGNLQSKPVRYQVNDEIWIWPPGRYGEATARLGSFRDQKISKQFNISQGGFADDVLDDTFRAGSMEEWNVPCLKCGHYQQPEWLGRRQDGSKWGMLYDTNDRTRRPDGTWNMGEVISSLRYECSACGHIHTDTPRTKAEWNRLGRYVVTNAHASPESVSLHYPAWIFRSWAEILEKYLEAKAAWERGVIEPLQEWYQKNAAICWSEMMGMAQLAKPTGTYEVNSEWPEEAHRFMTIDCQMEGVFWVVIRAWAKSGESRLIYVGKLFGFDGLRACQERKKIRSDHVLIDSGFDAKTVYYHCVLYGWIALKGDDSQAYPHRIRRGGQWQIVQRSYSPPAKGDPERGTSHEGRRFATLIRWSNDVIKDALKVRRDGRGPKWLRSISVEYENTTAQEYEKHINAEFKKCKVDAFSGKKKWAWVCPSGENHCGDCECEQEVAARIVGLLPDIEIQANTQEDK